MNHQSSSDDEPATPQSRTPNLFSGCYRPQIGNQEYYPQQFQQFPPQHYQPFPPQQYYPQFQQPFSPQQYLQFQQQFQQPSEPSPSQPIATSQSVAIPSKKSKKDKKKQTNEDTKVGGSRKEKWSEDEALHLSEYFIAVSEDPKISTNQDKDTFWYRIFHLHNAKWPQTGRTKYSVSGKWEHLRTKVNIFNGIYSQLIQSGGGRQSGTSDEDLLKAALAEYRVVQGQDFTHIQCWDFLKDKEKFLNPDPCVVGRRNKKNNTGLTQETSVNLDADDYDGGSDPFISDVRSARPAGRPRKSQKTGSSSGPGSGGSASSFFESINEQVANFNIGQSREAAQKEELNLEMRRVQRSRKLKYDMEILRMPTDGLSSADREAIDTQKERIRKNLMTGYYEL